MSIVIFKLITILNDNQISAVASQNGTYTLKSTSKYADIYDCNLKPLVNCTEKYDAVIIPNHISAIQLQPYIINKERYYDGITQKLPFLCEIDSNAVSSGVNAIIFRSFVRNDNNQLAIHTLGYTSDNKGICGIEKSYDDFIRENRTVNSVTFSVDAMGSVLNGIDEKTNLSESSDVGIITTLDKDIQQICENAFTESNISKGAVIVMDIRSGEIKAMASFPSFDANAPENYIDSADSPFLNRALSAYSVGSIFKLVTSAAALEQGISTDFSYKCTGSINVNGQIFNCHKWGGHGEIDMNTAVIESCNTYFIALSSNLNKEEYIDLAEALGFGEEILLCNDVVSSSGNLQTPEEISVPAECANLSFGQGKLTATPVQICRMTSAIANDGVITMPSLIKGIKDENGVVYNDITSSKRILSYTTTRKLQRFMTATVIKDNSVAVPDSTSAAGKTSTAQTGWFDEQGNEIYNCWFTGYFPVNNPQYAVTVLTEEGISGNISAGPVFKKIVDKVAEIKINNSIK